MEIDKVLQSKRQNLTLKHRDKLKAHFISPRGKVLIVITLENTDNILKKADVYQRGECRKKARVQSGYGGKKS